MIANVYTCILQYYAVFEDFFTCKSIEHNEKENLIFAVIALFSLCFNLSWCFVFFIYFILFTFLFSGSFIINIFTV